MAYPASSLLRCVAVSLGFGFLTVFLFAVFAQAAVDIFNDVLGVPMKFLLPFGFKGIHLDTDTLLDVVSGLVLLALIVSGLCFLFIRRQIALRRRQFWTSDEE